MVKFFAFLGTLPWLVAGDDLGRGGVSYVEMLLLSELWACERFVIEKAAAVYRRPGRPLSVSAFPFGLGIDIWCSSSFIGALFTSLSALPGRFMPCSFGANHCRPIGWESCGHGLTSRPRETASDFF